jgi:hypothetical protein
MLAGNVIDALTRVDADVALYVAANKWKPEMKKEKTAQKQTEKHP